MKSETIFEYARDDFNYPGFAHNILKKLLNLVLKRVQAANLGSGQIDKARFVVQALGIIALLFGMYLIAAIFVAVWLFIDQVNLHLFVDRKVAGSRFRHLVEEVPFVVALSIHMWLEGHLWTGMAGLVGITGLYLLTNLQMKYDLMAIQIPKLYFLRWDRMGIIFLFTLLAAWPGERAYLFVVLLAWFIAALSYYDYLWILIQLAKKKK